LRFKPKVVQSTLDCFAARALFVSRWLAARLFQPVPKFLFFPELAKHLSPSKSTMQTVDSTPLFKSAESIQTRRRQTVGCAAQRLAP
jgi:hypothetical protein